MNNRKKEGMKERKRTEEKRKKERKRKKEKEIGIKKEKKNLKMTFSIVEKFERVIFRYQTSKPRTRVYEYHCQWCHYLQQLVGRGSDTFPPSFFYTISIQQVEYQEENFYGPPSPGHVFSNFSLQQVGFNDHELNL